MAHVPAVPDFTQYSFALGDTDAAITKDNGRNAALVQFGNELRQTVSTFNQDLYQVAQDKQAAATSAGEAQTFRDQAQEISETGLPPKAGNAGKVLRVADDESGYILDGLLRHLLPVGEVKMFPGSVAPAGFLVIDGGEYSRTEKADLWAYAQASGNLAASEAGKDPAQFGPGDGSTTFTVPDYRGLFPRFWDAGRGIDPDRAIGETQQDQNKAHDHGGKTKNDTHSHGGSTNSDTHNHSGYTAYDGLHSHNYTARSNPVYSNGSSATQANATEGMNATESAGNHRHAFSTDSDTHSHGLNINSNTHNHGIDSDGGDEARPVNVALLPCMRY